MISERSVELKANASFLLVYRDQFGRDALQDVFPFLQMALPVMAVAQGEELDAVAATALTDGMEKFEIEVFFRLIWALAKNADKSIPSPEEWLDSFDDFPLFDVLADVLPLVLNSLIAKKKAPEKVEKAEKSTPTS